MSNDPFAIMRGALKNALIVLEKTNRWPTGTPGGKGGQFMPSAAGRAATGRAGNARIHAQEQASTASKPAAPNFAAHAIHVDNVNSASHNAKVALLQHFHSQGDVNGILRQSYGVNTYGKKQAKLANEALASLGSEHKVTPGQKRDTHSALSTNLPTPEKTPVSTDQKPQTQDTIALAPSAAPATVHSSWKQAATLPEALSQLKAVGMRFTNGYSGTPYSEKEFVALLNKIGPEAMRLHEKFPGIMSSVRLSGKRPASTKHSGSYTPALQQIALRNHKHGESSYKNKAGQPWTVCGAEGLHATLRHEMGHALDYQSSQKFRDALKQTQFEVDGKKVDTASWARHNVSEYAGTNTSEAIAEMFTIYTSPSYKAGTLPSAVENIMHGLANSKNNPSFAKATAGYETLIDFGPPPKGYELVPLGDDVSATESNIRFMAPDGSIKTFAEVYGSQE